MKVQLLPISSTCCKKVEYCEAVSNASQADPSFTLKDSKAFSEKQECRLSKFFHLTILDLLNY